MGCLLDGLRAFGIPNAILPFAGVAFFFVCVFSFVFFCFFSFFLLPLNPWPFVH